MARWYRFRETLRKKKSPKKGYWRKWQWKNDGNRSFLRDEQHYSSAPVLVGSKRKKDSLCDDHDFKSGVSPLIRDRLGLPQSDEFNNLSVFDRLCFKKKGHGKTRFRKRGSYRAVKHSKENVFVKFDNNLDLHKTDRLNGTSKSGVSRLIRDSLGLSESNRFSNLSVFDRLGSRKRRGHRAKGTLRHCGSKSGVSPLIRDRLEWPKPVFQKKQPFHEKQKFRKRGNYRRKKHFKGNIFININNDLHKIDIPDDMCEIDNNSQFQPQTDVYGISDDVSSEISCNDSAKDNFQVEVLPDFVSEIPPAGSFDFEDGVRSFESERFCVELYPMSELGSS